ncbi:MAG: T9SS type A sorting domain-containing protein [Bacteroidales bacterium]
MRKIYSLGISLILIFFMQLSVFAQKSITIEKQPAGINIDGVGDEAAWANAESNAITSILGGTPQDEFDFSASFELAWNDTALIYLVEANDFDIVPEDAWNADGFEMYFKFGSGTVTPPNIGDDRENGVFQVAVRLNNKPATGGYLPDSTRNHAVTVINEAQDGWVTEGYAAWGQFNNESGNSIIPGNGYTFRFDINVQDNDPDEDLVRGYWSSQSHLWDGDFSTSGVATLSSTVLDPQTSLIKTVSNKDLIYPNPVEDIITVSSSVNRITIYNVVGKKVFDADNSSGSKISLKPLQSGIYIVNFFNNENYLGSQKIIKKR